MGRAYHLVAAWIVCVCVCCPVLTAQTQISSERFSQNEIVDVGAGVCCIDDACRDDLSQGRCENQFCGQWFAGASSCLIAPVACLANTDGLCCVDGTCMTGFAQDACECEIGGTWMDGATSCAALLCPTPPVGSCCIDGSCIPGLSERDCVVDRCGSWNGADSDCQGALFCATIFGGVCCLNGTCDGQIGRDACECSGGTWNTTANSCAGVTCPDGPTGKCCVDGGCSVASEFDCVINQCGTWSGAGTDCSSPLCVVPAQGVCCLGTTCDESIGFDSCACAAGTWITGQADCAGVVCEPPLGRCCYGVTCSVATEADCLTQCGVWDGAQTDCVSSPFNACPIPVGACCVGVDCIGAIGAASCACEGGTWNTAETCLLSSQTDCDANGFIDICEGFTDCNNNSQPDDCELDCNASGLPDDCDISMGTSLDCNGNGVPDECDISSGFSQDCNTNNVPDECDIADMTSPDCNGDGVPDECDGNDCNGNGIPDDCELDPDCTQNFLLDCNFDGGPNECDADCQVDGDSDICQLIGEFPFGPALVDCAGGGPDVGSAFFGQLLHNANCAQCHGFGGVGGIGPNHRGLSRYKYQWKTSGCVFHNGGTFSFTDEEYANLQAWLSDLGGGGNGVPDGCEGLADCDSDGIADECEIAAAEDQGTSVDCNGNGIPDNCDIADMTSPDCNGNGVPDECDIDGADPDRNGAVSGDCNGNGIPDECDIADMTSEDCNKDGVPNECDLDCNTNGESDLCDIINGAVDCDGNDVPDECEPDCNMNGTVDACDILAGSSDLNGNGIPDECEVDCNGNMIPDDLDLIPGDVGQNAGVDYGSMGLAISDCDGLVDEILSDAIVVDFGASCGNVEHLVVSLRIAHPWVGDLVVDLQSPGGSTVTLLSRIGLAETNAYCTGGECCGDGSMDIDIVLDDSASASVESATDLTGSYQPDAGATGNPGVLSAFAGQSECGTWTLRVHDASEFDAGTLEAWALDFRDFAISTDCNANDIPDECDIVNGASDCNANGLPDECEDCNGNGLADECDIGSGSSDDCNGNDVPDECEGFRDCNGNGVLDSCDIDSQFSPDCNGNLVPDECDLSGFGGLFVSSLSSTNVVQFDSATGNQLGEFVISGSGGLSNPGGLVFHRSGDLLVADFVADTIGRYDGADGSFSGAFVDVVVAGASDMTIGPNGNLFALNFQGGVVQEFDGETGESIGVFAQLPVAPSPELAVYMVFDPSGDLYLSNFTSGEILRFDGVSGTLIGPLTTGGTLSSPVGMAFGADGHLYVADSAENNIQRYDGTTGVFIDVFVDDLLTGGQTVFADMEFGPDGNLYVTHSSGNAVVVFDGQDGTLIGPLPPGDAPLSFPFAMAFRPASSDCNGNGIPDECEDCNGNGLADVCDIMSGDSLDVNGNGIPDECEGPDVVVELVTRKLQSGIDSASTLPASDASFMLDDSFVVELWATDRGAVNTGLEQVYVDLSFDAAHVQAAGIVHRPPFTDSVSGTIDNVNGSIADLGGTDVGASGAGIEPEWRRVAYVQYDVDACPADADFVSSASVSDVVAVGRGVIDPAEIAFGTASVSVSAVCAYDLDGSGFVNAGDSGLFAGCWLTGQGDAGYDPVCDFDCSGFVDAGDLGWFAVAWLRDCSELTDADLPPCRRCVGP